MPVDVDSTTLALAGCLVLFHTFMTAGVAVHCPHYYADMPFWRVVFHVSATFFSYAFFIAAALINSKALLITCIILSLPAMAITAMSICATPQSTTATDLNAEDDHTEPLLIVSDI